MLSPKGGRRLRSRALASLAGDEAFVRTLHERTDGVPLFVASLMTDAIMRTSAMMTATRKRDSRMWRFRRIWRRSSIITSPSWGTKSALCSPAAAVCGVEFRVNTIADVLGRDAASVAEMCEQLVREQLWLTARVPGTRAAWPSCRIRSGTRFRQVLYERTPASVRTQLHRKVGLRSNGSVRQVCQ